MSSSMRNKFASIAAAGALAAFASGAVRAEDPLTNLGPVGPREPILVTVGKQRVIAFFVSERGECAVNAVTWNSADADAPYASSRVRISLKPGQVVQLDGAERKSMGLLCGMDASSLAVTAPAELALVGTEAAE
jgi:hypothetical protein